MSWQEAYKQWSSFSDLEPSLKKQLEHLSRNQKQLEDAFYTKLSFGTAGIRGELGPGPNRMNIYTVRKASEGLAHYIDTFGEVAKARGVVIAYDSRHQSEEFAKEAARTLHYHGIQVYVFESLRSTPELSFAVRYLHAFSGIVITASHNPKEYNGFKVYGSDGCQVSLEGAEAITNHVNKIKNELQIDVSSLEELESSNLYHEIGGELDEAYLQQVEKLVLRPDVIEQVASDFTIVYSPLHGTGNRPVREVLKRSGFKDIHIVKEQELPDPDFPTVTFPNPEENAAFELAIRDGKRYSADILLATDPDADRVGLATKNREGIYTVLTGNQIGVLILHYLITQKKAAGILSQNYKLLKTIVTSELGRVIADAYGLETIDTLTGFKFIGEKISEFEKSGEDKFLFGYEESYGYLAADFVRDKDAVQTCLLIAEVAAYYKLREMNLFDALDEIYRKYGYYKESLKSLTLKGKDGIEQIGQIMTQFRENPFLKLAGKEVEWIEDYQQGVKINVLTKETDKLTLPQSNVVKYIFTDGAWICIRPSGTEPKIKFYFGVNETSHMQADEALLALQNELNIYLENKSIKLVNE